MRLCLWCGMVWSRIMCYRLIKKYLIRLYFYYSFYFYYRTHANNFSVLFNVKSWIIPLAQKRSIKVQFSQLEEHALSKNKWDNPLGRLTKSMTINGVWLFGWMRRWVFSIIKLLWRSPHHIFNRLCHPDH